MAKEIYVSVDIESDGPIPGKNSMLSIGAAAFNVETNNPHIPIATFERNLLPLPNAVADEATMAFWRNNQAAYDITTSNQVDPAIAMHDLAYWLNILPGKPVFVGYPMGFDFMFTHWYLQNFTGGDPFGWSGLDIKTMAMMMMGTAFRDSTKRRMPKQWIPSDYEHDHTALTDAIGQGKLFVNMYKEWKNGRKEQ